GKSSESPNPAPDIRGAGGSTLPASAANRAESPASPAPEVESFARGSPDNRLRSGPASQDNPPARGGDRPPAPGRSVESWDQAGALAANLGDPYRPPSAACALRP